MKNGFTLSELLIALVILGLIATFTIPKVLSSQQDNRSKSIAKEVAGMLAESLQVAKHADSLNGTSDFNDLTPFINYVNVETAAQLDMVYGQGTDDCIGGGWTCLRLHNGALVNYHPTHNFDGTASTNLIYILLDPDGKVTGGGVNGPGKSVALYLYYDGKIRTRGTIAPNSVSSWGAHTPNSSQDPPWFSWN